MTKSYMIREGDTPMKIAQGFTGNAARYGELLAANPQIPTAVTPEGYRTFAYMPKAGESLRVPDAWRRQMGVHPRGGRARSGADGQGEK